MTTTQINIEGMSCEGCSSFVQRFLSAAKGVIKADVSLENASATLEFDENLTSADELIKAINEETHYKAALSN